MGSEGIVVKRVVPLLASLLLVPSSALDESVSVSGTTVRVSVAADGTQAVDLRVQTDPSPYCDLLMKLRARSSTLPWNDLISIDVAGCAR
jgi:hypothetical protein